MFDGDPLVTNKSVSLMPISLTIPNEEPTDIKKAINDRAGLVSTMIAR